MSDKNKLNSENKITGIHCDVANCTYNDKNCNCFADEIKVGPTHAESSSDTVCATFRQKK